MAGDDYFLQTFGELRLLGPDGKQVSCPERGVLILAYLKTNDRNEVSREHIGRLLWPDVSKEVAFKNLRSTLWRMRDLSAARQKVPYEITPTSLTLGHLPSDLDRFEQRPETIEALEKCLTLWRETFLHGLIATSEDLARWLREQRTRFTEHLRQAVIALSGGIYNAASHRVIKMVCAHLLEVQPDDNDIIEILKTVQSHQSCSVVEISFRQVKRQAPEATKQPDLPRVALIPPLPSGCNFLYEAAGTAVIEDITIGLCSLRTMSVVAPYTAERIRDAPDKAAILEKHNVTYALDCRLSDRGLFAQLIFLPSDRVLWAERFPLSLTGLVEQREQIALQVARAVTDRVGDDLGAQQHYAQHPEVYYSYLTGVQHLGGLGLPSIRRARKEFRQALRLDKGFAPALSGLSRSFSTEWLLLAQGDPQLLRQAEQHARDAVDRDVNLAAAHRDFGVVKLYQGELDESLSALDLAEYISPHYADVLYSHADTLVHASRPGEALEKLERAISLNPMAPDAYLWCAAGASYFLGRYADAVSYAQKMKNKAPSDRIVAASWAMLGDRKRALVHRIRAVEANPSFDVDRWLAIVPFKEQWQRDLYREGLKKAGF